MQRVKKLKLRALSKMKTKEDKNNLSRLRNNNKKLQPQRLSRSKSLIRSQKIFGQSINKSQQKRGKSKKS